MRIESSQLQLEAQSQVHERRSLRVNVRDVAMTVPVASAPAGNVRGLLPSSAPAVPRVDTSAPPNPAAEESRSRFVTEGTPRPNAIAASHSPSSQAAGKRTVTESAETDPLAEDKALTPTLRLAVDLLRRIFGVEIEVINPKTLETRASDDLPHASPASVPPATAPNTPAEQETVLNVQGTVMTVHAAVVRTEALAFSATGVVRTADGRSIEFAAGFALVQQESTEVNLEIAALTGTVAQRPKKDPLVLDFAGTAAELRDIGLRFDLMGNGELVNLPVPVQGLGFLVFDRNGNGRADDGRELFGAITGDGFTELAALDSDGNGWIDEGDAAWSQLYVWHPYRRDELIALKDADVGAIALASVRTPWRVQDASGNELGLMQKTGIYLKESGGVGTVSHVDVAV